MSRAAARAAAVDTDRTRKGVALGTAVRDFDQYKMHDNASRAARARIIELRVLPLRSGPT